MKTILVCGYGPGISHAVATKFASEGFSVALVARNADKLAAATATLASEGIAAKAFPADLSDWDAVKAVVASARSQLGPIAVLHWNAASLSGADLLQAKAADLRLAFDVGVTGLVAAVQEALPDLKAQSGAVLVTGGGLSNYSASMDAMAVRFGFSGPALGKAAQRKLSGLLAERLRPEGVYLGEVVVNAMVKGTAADNGTATLEPSAIAATFWDLYTARMPHSVALG
ncbi:SDR family NAD(P)-dependent oxidoreductase [Chondromyces crocatus]|uniref:Short-chain dehydrogenase n=1 Tax=Chondromyces crocatus TaxID=52 RepID=A0A0K1ET72_CHOCO|nr:SDR family NAD(P)-dependent oxidoreductase [Chondromyces crocatus]AKT44110.1 short-chain dehydrogenase [Chondromyces crocatus]